MKKVLKGKLNLEVLTTEYINKNISETIESSEYTREIFEKNKDIIFDFKIMKHRDKTVAILMSSLDHQLKGEIFDIEEIIFI